MKAGSFIVKGAEFQPNRLMDINRDTDKTSTDKTSNRQKIDVAKNDRTNHLKKDRHHLKD